MRVKKFLVFRLWDHDSAGGWNDLEAHADSLEEAKTIAKKMLKGSAPDEFVDIVDTQAGEMGELVWSEYERTLDRGR